MANQKINTSTRRRGLPGLAERLLLDPIRRKIDRARYSGPSEMSDPSDFQSASRRASSSRQVELEILLEEREERWFGGRHSSCVNLPETVTDSRPGEKKAATVARQGRLSAKRGSERGAGPAGPLPNSDGPEL